MITCVLASVEGGYLLGLHIAVLWFVLDLVVVSHLDISHSRWFISHHVEKMALRYQLYTGLENFY